MQKTGDQPAGREGGIERGECIFAGMVGKKGRVMGEEKLKPILMGPITLLHVDTCFPPLLIFYLLFVCFSFQMFVGFSHIQIQFFVFLI